MTEPMPGISDPSGTGLEDPNTGRAGSDRAPEDSADSAGVTPGCYRLRESVRHKDRLLVATRPLVATRINEPATRVVAALSTDHYRHANTVAEDSGIDPSAATALLEKLHSRGFLDWKPARDPTYQPTVSVVVTVRNEADHIGACLDALEELVYPEYEVLVVDDSSTDGTRSIIKSHPCQPRLIELGEPDSPIGIGAARNEGVAAANNEVVALTDADCRPRPDWLAELVPVLGVSDVVGGRVRPATETGASAYEAVNSSLDMGSRAARIRRDGRTPYLPTANLLTRTTVAETVGFPNRNVAEDVKFCWTALEQGYDVVYEPEGVVDHDYGEKRLFGRRRRSYGASEALLATEFSPAGAVPIPTVPLVLSVLLVVVMAVVLSFSFAESVVGLVMSAGVATCGSVWQTRRQSGGLVSPAEAVRSLGRRTLSSAYSISREFTRYYSLLSVALASIIALLYPLAGMVSVAVVATVVVFPALVEYSLYRPSIRLLSYMQYYIRDHLNYQFGVYRGAVVYRTVQHLNPAERFSAGAADN
jgi:mycofactocin system glycosyltransferase